ncbi:MAG: cob(I)yrinic acid a,c-diamide adenosyltransferase [Lachnospiraceae bacterium]|nr:cob(I)yrinic acid a,c-diamide adenosyltransferase [Lachnospiraceae bacterium]
MVKGIKQVFYGQGKGKTSAAVGQCIRSAGQGQSVIIIQFLKGSDAEELQYLSQFEPDIKLFRFEREYDVYDDLPASKKKEERENILNGINYVKKVINSGECDVLVLDEIFGLVEHGIFSTEELIELLKMDGDYKRLILTGCVMPEEIRDYVDIISKIELEKDNTV